MKKHEPKLFDPDDVMHNLCDNRFVRDIHVYRSVSSTNVLARRLAESGAATGTLVLAEKQTAGKGRLGRSWSSPEGVGLWFSLIVRAAELPVPVATLPLALCADVGLALREEFGLDFVVKWPNDILYKGQKVCGILCESSFAGQTVQYVVAGIGVNVNQVKSDFPEPMRDLATSLRRITGESQDRLTVLAAILAKIEQRFSDADVTARALVDWRNLCTDIGRTLRIQTGERVFAGEFVDITDTGEMLFREPDGAMHRLLSGQVTILK
ncbi:MAG: biotin--[acetyl-CoA-carboxylase] ligase [Deferribacteres bacterium]|nr:biotin--[acetyl-CoA-carboxylase] ligase [Deferribacteres bacterium]